MRFAAEPASNTTRPQHGYHERVFGVRATRRIGTRAEGRDQTRHNIFGEVIGGVTAGPGEGLPGVVQGPVRNRLAVRRGRR